MTMHNYLNPKILLKSQVTRTTMRSGILIPPNGFLSSPAPSRGCLDE